MRLHNLRLWPKTPVLVFADLAPELQVADDDERLLSDARRLDRQHHRIAEVRCQARARGDSQVATDMKIPVDGGYRCRSRVHGSGLLSAA